MLFTNSAWARSRAETTRGDQACGGICTKRSIVDDNKILYYCEFNDTGKTSEI